jgi:hypothetical protein
MESILINGKKDRIINICAISKDNTSEKKVGPQRISPSLTMPTRMQTKATVQSRIRKIKFHIPSCPAMSAEAELSFIPVALLA